MKRPPNRTVDQLHRDYDRGVKAFEKLAKSGIGVKPPKPTGNREYDNGQQAAYDRWLRPH